MGSLPVAGAGLRSQPMGIRIGVSALIVVLYIGLLASVTHMVSHFENRDELPGFTFDDVTSAYHGIDSPGLLGTALERGHPETLPSAEKELLLQWLTSGRIVEDYDSLDLEIPPAEIIDQSCIECHTRAAGAETGSAIPPLEYFDDIKEIAFSRKVLPTPVAVLAASTHAHALALSIQGLVVIALASMTRWRRRPISLLIAIMGLGLVGDVGGWWLARFSPSWTVCIMVSGAGYSLAQGILLASVLADLWWPRASIRDSQ
ncbi:MAG TPA: hypothetical protein EYQ08_04090 [Planctomycetes bacterium]|nr:hypothetical protein [Planctomycetota bacterium]HIK82206.1 hypothetical protein [Planctomycetota bacterium]